jgi:hypothetical protein
LERKGNKGPASFCVPRAAIAALLDAKATAYEICAYLILAKFTEASGVYSTASRTSIETYTGSNKRRAGPVGRAIERLKTIRAKQVIQVSNGRAGKAQAMVAQETDLGPILYDREGWTRATGEVLDPRDGPGEQMKVLHVLPALGEPFADRVWFGAGLVDGFEEFKLPLKKIRHGGDAVARLLLSMYEATDMETWGGVDPRKGPWRCYAETAENSLNGGARLIRAREVCHVRKTRLISEGYWDALELLESSGLFYEAVLVLNRNAEKTKFASGKEYGDIPSDAEPYYELDARSHHGFKPAGEEGLAGITAATAGEFRLPVADANGNFDGTYAAIVPRGQGAMIAGIFRPRFRPANKKSAGVSGAWCRIRQSNEDALEFINAIRVANKLEPLPAPWVVAEEKKAARDVSALDA